jgi:hypothetical protein
MNHSCRIHLADGIIHAVGRRSVRKTTPAKLSHPTSISSGEKEVSHGHEEGEEEEDVEVTSPARASYWGRALASYFARHLSLNDSGRTQTRPLLFFTALTGLSGHAAADEKLVVAQHCRRGSAQRAGVDPPDLILFAARRLALLSYPLSPIAARGSTSGPRSRSTGNCDASPFSWPEHGAVPKTRQSRRRTSKRACLLTLQL